MFAHPKAAERARCPIIDGHYVPKRCQLVYYALRGAAGWAGYDRLVVDGLKHTRHERKLRELRELNTEYDAAGRVIWDLVLTRQAPGGKHVEFLYNRTPRPVTADSRPQAPSTLLLTPTVLCGALPASQSVLDLIARDFCSGICRSTEQDILDLLEV